MAIIRKSTTTSTDLPPAKLPSVTSIDTNKGSITITGAEYSGGRRIRGTGKITRVEGNISQSQAQQIAEKTALSQQQVEQFNIARQQRQNQIVQAAAKGKTSVITTQELPPNQETYYRRIGNDYYQTTIQGGIVRKYTPEEAKNLPEISQEVPNYSSASARQTLSSKERIKYAYESAGKAELNVRGAIRAGMEALQIGIEKTPIYPKIKKYDIEVSAVPFENLIIATAFLPPQIATTTQIQKQLFSAQKVRFVGATQETIEGATITEAAFTAERAGKNIQGIAKAVSTKIGQGEAVDIYKTGTVGAIFKRGIIFPTSQEVIVPTAKAFVSAEVSAVKPQGEGFLVSAIGKIKSIPKAEVEAYRSASIGAEIEDYIYSVGVSQGKGVSYSFGALKVSKKFFPDTFIITGGGEQATANLPKTTQALAGISALKSSVQAADLIQPTQTFSQTISASLGSITTNPLRKVTSQSLNIRTISSIKSAQPTVFRISSPSLQKSNLIIKTQTIQESAQKSILKTFQIQPQPSIQKYKFLQVPKIQQPLREQLKMAIPTPRISVKNPRLFFPVFKIKRMKEALSFKPAKLYVKEKGAFKFRGIFPLPRAIERGVDITQKSISRSFKITGTNAGLPIGYRRSRKRGQQNVFVELPKTALSQLGEQFEIRAARKMKGGRKRR